MKLLNNHKGKLIVSSIIILLPMLFGVLASKILPAEIAVHWSASGNADGFMNSSMIFFILPAILLAFHWLCMILTAVLDPNAAENQKMFGMMFWIIPAISLIGCGMIFAGGLGYATKLSAPVYIILGLTFIVIGNYMPKTTRNVTMGIKIKWTLANDDNWSATHRLAGKIYVAVGFLLLFAIPLPVKVLPYLLISTIVAACLIPALYSYCFYKKQLREGTATVEGYQEGMNQMFKAKKAPVIISIVAIALILLALIPLMFMGTVETVVGDDALTVKATFWEDLTVAYDEIDGMEYREEGVDGSRVAGYGSAKLLLGGFQNDEFGSYTRYTYTGDGPCIVLTVGNRTIVIGTENAETTADLYEQLGQKLIESVE